MLASPKSTAATGSHIGLADDGSLPANVVAAWVAQLARALKTCRLYDGENPTVIKFREDVARELVRLLAEGAPLTLGFTSTDVVYGEASVYAARSREDNLARPFFRDGISAITFHPGMQAADFERFLDQMLRVTAAHSADEDLVTLLWDAQIPHFDFEYVPAIAEGGGVRGNSDERTRAIERLEETWVVVVRAEERIDFAAQGGALGVARAERLVENARALLRRPLDGRVEDLRDLAPTLAVHHRSENTRLFGSATTPRFAGDRITPLR